MQQETLLEQGHAGTSSVFYFDQYWWVPFMTVFVALLLSAYTYRKKPRCENGKILRHDAAARFSHWFNAAGILILLYSGYQLGFLDFGRKVWFTDGVRQMFNLHFIGAVLFLLGAVYWVGNTFLHPKRLEEHSPYKGSIKDAILHYLKLMGLPIKKGERPTGKYEASERLAFIPLTLLALFMGITGLIKLAAHVWHVPTGLLKLATFTHDWSTLLLAVLLVFHIILAAVVPWAWPMLRSMITGYMSVELLKSHHKGWYEELKREGLCSEDENDKKGEDNANA